MTTDKEDITARLREASTHALMDASRELVRVAADEIERLRNYRDEAESRASILELAIRRLANQDATLRGLLERTQPTQTTPSVCSVPARDTVADEPPPDPERFNEWLRKPYWVDPPSGWRYGFPKLYDPAKDGNMTEWMVANGYPQHLADKGLPCTFTSTE